MDVNITLTKGEMLTENPLPFLNGDLTVGDQFTHVCSNLYKLCQEKNKFSKITWLPELHTNGFDEEQIWQQIELFNDSSIITCMQRVQECNRDPYIQLIPTENDEVENDEKMEDQPESDLSGSDREDAPSEDIPSENGINRSEDEMNPSEDEMNSKKTSQEKLQRTEVDDDFFSLRQMENFLNDQENNVKNTSDDEIDLFDDIPSTDGEEDFPDIESDASGEIDGPVEDQKEKLSARDIKYDDFFPVIGEKSQSENLEMEDDSDEEVDSKTQTSHEKQTAAMQKRIKQLEMRALQEKEWQMRGETTADHRPVNSLLEEVLTFDKGERTAPEVTDEQTHDIETIIKQRIKDKSWDDVERKIKEVKNAHEYKKKIVLDSEKSKMSLQEIYEKEYISKVSGTTDKEKEDPAHVEIKSLMQNLFKKLDALSNFHFHASAPTPEIQIVSNLPTVAMEEVQPTSQSDAGRLAPEEVHGSTEVKADEEKTPTDRKRERRKKKLQQKVRSKARVAKLARLADSNEKLKAIQAVQKLEQSAKMKGSQTTIIKGKKKGEKLGSSKSFFAQLDVVNQKQNLKKKTS